MPRTVKCGAAVVAHPRARLICVRQWNAARRAERRRTWRLGARAAAAILLGAGRGAGIAVQERWHENQPREEEQEKPRPDVPADPERKHVGLLSDGEGHRQDGRNRGQQQDANPEVRPALFRWAGGQAQPCEEAYEGDEPDQQRHVREMVSSDAHAGAAGITARRAAMRRR